MDVITYKNCKFVTVNMKYLTLIGIFAFGFLSGMGVLYLFNEVKSEKDNEFTTNKKENYSLLMHNFEDKNQNSDTDSPNIKKQNVDKGENMSSDEENVKANNDDLYAVDSLDDMSDSLNVEDDIELDEDSLLVVELDLNQDEEGVVVKKEKLIHSKKYKVKVLDKDENEEIDSLIEKSMGVKKVRKNEIWVEFWQSPLSSRGYVYRNHKVKLYGVDPQLSLSFYIKDEQMYLNTEADLFHLIPTDEFQKFIFVNKDILKD